LQLRQFAVFLKESGERLLLKYFPFTQESETIMPKEPPFFSFWVPLSMK